MSYLNKDADSEASYLLQRSDSLHSYSTVIYHLVRHVNAEKQDGLRHTNTHTHTHTTMLMLLLLLECPN